MPVPAPVASATPAPVPSPAVDQAAPIEPDNATADDGAAAADDATTTSATVTGMPVWPFVLVGVLVLAGLAFLLLRRRRENDELAYPAEAVAHDMATPMAVEPVHETVAPVAATAAPAATAVPAAIADMPVAPAVPAVPDDAIVAAADDDDVAALTAVAPVDDRPWLEFALRPLRAGTNVDEALVEIELTVGNAGAVAATDVRIATYMLADGAEVGRFLAATPSVDGAVDPVTIDPGEGTRIDATLAVLRASLAGDGFAPVVVADARYRLPDGGEGRTTAAFAVGRAIEGVSHLAPIDLGSTAMFDDVEAQLYRQPEHA